MYKIDSWQGPSVCHRDHIQHLVIICIILLLKNLVWLFVTPWTVQSMEFSRPEYWSGSLFHSPGDLPYPGSELSSPALQVNSLPAESQGKPSNLYWKILYMYKWISLRYACGYWQHCKSKRSIKTCTKKLLVPTISRSSLFTCCSYALQETNSLRRTMHIVECSCCTSGPKTESPLSQGPWPVSLKTLHTLSVRAQTHLPKFPETSLNKGKERYNQN